MKTIVGLAIGCDAVRAVAMRRSRILWAAHRARSDNSTLEEDIATLLRGAPQSRWQRTCLVAAVGPESSQLKRLMGLPSMLDDAALSEIVRKASTLFYLGGKNPLVTSDVRTMDSDSWGAAFDSSVVKAVRDACKSLRIDLRYVTATNVILAFATPQRNISWVDGATMMETAHRADGTLSFVARSRAIEPSTSPPPVHSSLASLGEDAWLFADAFGAAIANPHEQIAWRPGVGREGSRSAPSTSRKLSIAALLISGLTATFAPGVRNAMSARHSGAQLSAIASRLAHAVAGRTELAQMTEALTEVSAFANARHSQVALLSEITRVLPQYTALASLHVDSAGGTIIIVAPRLENALGRLDSVQAISAAEISGPVVRQITAGTELERASIHFRFSHSYKGTQ
jgi:hypothetical protein